MQKIIPHLWFDMQAEDAANFYVSVFKEAGKDDSEVLNVSHYPKAAEEVSGQKAGTVMTVVFKLDGQQFMALNGGPMFKFNESISFVINCEGQKEVDFFWKKLSAVPESEVCGWLKDKFGLSWQVVPIELGELMQNVDPTKSDKVMAKLLKMKKIDIKKLKKAAEG